MKYDVVIVGGGLIGMMTAYELLQEHLKIAIIDKSRMGSEASAAGGGILSSLMPWKEPEPAQALYAWSQQHYPLICENLLNATQTDPEYLESGLVILRPQRDENLNEWLHKHREDTQVIGLDESAIIFPKAEAELLWLARVGQVNPPRLITTLKQYLLQQGVDLFEHNPVNQLVVESNNIMQVITEHGQFRANHYVLAAGAWSGQDSFHADITMKPVRGQMIRIRLDNSLTDKIILDQKKYCIPRANNDLIVGSTLEDVGFDSSTTEKAREELMGFAASLFPELADIQPDDHWAGLRPDCGRDRPIIGIHAQIENLYVNTGHFRNGILAAPASAKVLSDMIFGRETIVDSAAFAHIVP